MTDTPSGASSGNALARRVSGDILNAGEDTFRSGSMNAAGDRFRRYGAGSAAWPHSKVRTVSESKQALLSDHARNSSGLPDDDLVLLSQAFAGPGKVTSFVVRELAQGGSQSNSPQLASLQGDEDVSRPHSPSPRHGPAGATRRSSTDRQDEDETHVAAAAMQPATRPNRVNSLVEPEVLYGEAKGERQRDDGFEPDTVYQRSAELPVPASVPGQALMASQLHRSGGSRRADDLRMQIAVQALQPEVVDRIATLVARYGGIDQEKARRIVQCLGEGALRLEQVDAAGRSEFEDLLLNARRRDVMRVVVTGIFGYLGFFTGGMMAMKLGAEVDSEQPFDKVAPFLFTCMGIALVNMLTTNTIKRGRLGQFYSAHQADAPGLTGWNRRDRLMDAAWSSFALGHALVDLVVPVASSLWWRTMGSGFGASAFTAAAHAAVAVPVSGEPALYPWLDVGAEPLPDDKRSRHYGTANERLDHALRSLRQDSIDAAAGYVADFFHGVEGLVGFPDAYTVVDFSARTVMYLGMLSPRMGANFQKDSCMRRALNVASDLLLGTFGLCRRVTHRVLARKGPNDQPLYPFMFNLHAAPLRRAPAATSELVIAETVSVVPQSTVGAPGRTQMTEERETASVMRGASGRHRGPSDPDDPPAVATDVNEGKHGGAGRGRSHEPAAPGRARTTDGGVPSQTKPARADSGSERDD